MIKIIISNTLTINGLSCYEKLIENVINEVVKVARTNKVVRTAKLVKPIKTVRANKAVKAVGEVKKAKAIRITYSEKLLQKKAFQEIAFDINLILTEAISNAFYHGNKGDASKPIGLSYKCNGEILKLKISNSGEMSKNIHIPDEIKDEDLLNEGGRGLFLIKALADKVEFNNNTLKIDKYICI